MIFVNLLNDIKTADTDIQSFQGIQEVSSPVDIKELTKIILKMSFILMPSLAIFGWTVIEKQSQEAILNELKSQEQEVMNKLETQKQSRDEINNLKKEKLKLDNLIASLSQVTSQRIKTLEALNTLHFVVPDNAWLTEVSIDSKNGEVTFTGESIPNEINIFESNLKKQSRYFKDIQVLDLSSQSSYSDPYRKFQITSVLQPTTDSEITMPTDQVVAGEIKSNMTPTSINKSPFQPSQPDQPGQPDQPNQPVQPSQPDQPGQPDQPSQNEAEPPTAQDTSTPNNQNKAVSANQTEEIEEVPIGETKTTSEPNNSKPEENISENKNQELPQ